jgi:hypothetical protein
MNLPGFYAETSPEGTSNCYRSRGAGEPPGVTPSLLITVFGPCSCYTTWRIDWANGVPHPYESTACICQESQVNIQPHT